MKMRLFAVVVLVALCAVMLPAKAAAAPAVVVDMLSAGRADQAIATLQAHLQSFPGDAEAHYLLLRAYFALNRWDEAVEQGEKAVQLAPKDSRYHAWLGRAYGEKANHSSFVNAISSAKKTRAEFEQAVALSSTDITVRADLAEYYVEAPGFIGGSKDKARALADEVRKLGSEPTALWILSKIAESNKDYDQAEKYLQIAISTSHSDPEKILNLASFYRRRGRTDDTERTVQQAIQAVRSLKQNFVLVDAAELLYRVGRNYDGALKLLRTYINSSEHSEDAPVFRAYYMAGQILEKQGDKQTAAQQYRAALSLASGFEPAKSALRKLGNS